MNDQAKSQPSQGGLQQMEGDVIDHNKLGTASPGGSAAPAVFDPEIPVERSPSGNMVETATSQSGGAGPGGTMVSNGPEDADRLQAGGTQAHLRESRREPESEGMSEQSGGEG